MTHKQFCSLALVVCIFGSVTAAAQSFEAFRLKSGMTPDQISRTWPTYEFRWLEQRHPGTGSAVLIKDEDIFASLSLCNNSLVGLARNVDADTDFVRYLDDYLKEFGQPRVSTRRDAWTGPGRGDVETVEFTWIRKDVRYEISFNPEGRTGSGELRHLRNASIGFFLLANPCMSKNKR
jgi:hypothetical protein